MKLHASLLVATFGLFLLSGCGEQGGGGGEAAVTKTKVDYHVIINSIGAIKVTHKDTTGQMIVEEEFAAKAVGDTWSKQYEFEGPVDAELTLELAASAPPDPVGVEFYIALDGSRVQKATKFLTKGKPMTLKVNRP